MSAQHHALCCAHGVLRGHAVTAIGVLRERLTEPWTLEALANEVQLVRVFDATVGMSPMAYLRKMRVELMARLLVSTDLSVAETARPVGWKNRFTPASAFTPTTASRPPNTVDGSQPP